MQAQSSLTTAMTEESTGQYADLGLQLGDQSGYELSLKEQVGQLQTLTSGNSLVSTSLSTAQAALSAISSSAQSTLNDLATWTPSANSGASLQNMGQSALQSLIASTNATSGDQYVFGGINSAVAPMADYYSTPPSAAKTAVDQAFETAFGVLANRSGRGEHLRFGHAELSFRAVCGAVPGRRVELGLVVGLEHEHQRRDRARPDGHDFDQRQSARLSRACAGLHDVERIRRVAAQQRRAAGRRHRRVVARLAGRDSMTNTQAELGSTQSAVTNANNSMSSQLTILQDQVGNLDDVNANTTAAQITSLTNQIQMAYELTSRLSQLNLAQYLPVS